ncbi:MAG: c-type cytochrome [Rhodocyclaceae bacterium]|nr:c-type cytochrome [Rhodocyclaceae bacterium]
MTRRWSVWALATGALAMSAAAHAAPPTAAMLANACGGCHGTQGASAGPSMPNLAGQSKKALVEAMKAFKSGERSSTVMGRLTKGYSDADIVAMSEYFSKQKPTAYAQAVDAKKADKGGMLQEKHCGRCHVDDGQDFKDDAPIMAGQWLGYLQIQMDEYISGKRKMSEKMAEKVKHLSADDMDAIAHFYASEKMGETK